MKTKENKNSNNLGLSFDQRITKSCPLKCEPFLKLLPIQCWTTTHNNQQFRIKPYKNSNKTTRKLDLTTRKINQNTPSNHKSAPTLIQWWYSINSRFFIYHQNNNDNINHPRRNQNLSRKTSPPQFNVKQRHNKFYYQVPAWLQQKTKSTAARSTYIVERITKKTSA